MIDEYDHVVYQQRAANELAVILQARSICHAELQGIVVESTYNWNWLVDGLMEHGYTFQLANTGAIQQYEGPKHTNDRSDARWLAHLLRLDVLPEGSIDPRADRPVRDLLRKRSQMGAATHHQSVEKLEFAYPEHRPFAQCQSGQNTRWPTGRYTVAQQRP